MGKILKALNAIYKSKKRLDGLTQKIIAERLGVAPSAVSQYLSGDTGISTELLERFCAALGVKLSDLENWNPELAEIRFSTENAEGNAPPELAKMRAQLETLYKMDRAVFDSVAGVVDAMLKRVGKKATDRRPGEQKHGVA